jgi:hypothetical protein
VDYLFSCCVQRKWPATLLELMFAVTTSCIYFGRFVVNEAKLCKEKGS